MHFKKLDKLKAKLNVHRPLDSQMVENLRDDLILRWTYNSNAIEGNTLTLNETKVALEGITVAGKSLHGFPPVVLKVQNRLAYYDALDKAHSLGDYDDFIALLTKIVEESFEPYWFVLGVKS